MSHLSGASDIKEALTVHFAVFAHLSDFVEYSESQGNVDPHEFEDYTEYIFEQSKEWIQEYLQIGHTITATMEDPKGQEAFEVVGAYPVDDFFVCELIPTSVYLRDSEYRLN